MIHSVAVAGGTSVQARVAQRHAIQMALLFGARLRVIVTWEADEAERARADGAPEEILQSLVDEEMKNVSWEVGESPLTVERRVHGAGRVAGALAVASESDLLVVGLSEQGADEERALLSKADCLVLAVHQPPQSLQRILVDYQGGTEGKAALRIAGEVAERSGAAVTVLCISGDLSDAGTLAADAERYLAAFRLSEVDKIEHRGNPTSQNEVLRAANSVSADLIVVGKERHGFFAGLLNRATLDPEDLAEDITLPVLIAR